MSTQQPGVAVEKPKSDIYTAMLFISLLAIGLAITCLCLEMDKYEWDYKANSVKLNRRPASWIETAPAAPSQQLYLAWQTQPQTRDQL